MAKKKSRKTAPKKKITTPTPSTDFSKWYYAAFIFVFAFVLYANTISHGFVLDDDLVCKKNSYVQTGISSLVDIFSHSWYHGFTGVEGRYYRPMMLAGFAIETSFIGKEANNYHIMNVLYYSLGCALLFLVLRHFFEKKSLLLPFAIALLFTVHPLHTEVVANIKSRDEIFTFLGLLGVMYGILKHAKTNQIQYFILALFSYAFAIFSKEGALSILGIVPLTLYFFTKTSFQKIAIQTAIFLVPAFLFLGIRYSIINHEMNPFETIDNSLLAIEGTSGRLATAIGMLGKYFQLLIFPHPLSFDYSYNTFPELSWIHWKVLGSLAASGGLIYLTIKGLREKNIFSFAILFFAITFVITSNIFFLIGATFAERFMFIPLLGFCIIVGTLLHKYIINKNPESKTAFGIALSVIVLLYSVKTFTQNQIWKNDDTLFETGIYTAPNSSRTQSFYGVMNYRRALASKDANERKNYLDTSVEYLKKSIETYPGFTETYQHLALTYEAQNQNQLALETYKNAIKTNSNYYQAMTNSGVLYYKLKNYSEAERFLQQALTIAPNNAITQRSMGLVYKAKGQYDLAITHFENALNLQYNERHLVDLGMLYEQMGNPEKAMMYNQKIIELKKKLAG